MQIADIAEGKDTITELEQSNRRNSVFETFGKSGDFEKFEKILDCSDVCYKFVPLPTPSQRRLRENGTEEQMNREKRLFLKSGN